MQSTLYALVDCNNFFVSCERVFNPKLKNRPVVVLSNNDGCVVSRSNEAKKLGIPMGEPFFKLQDLVKKYGVVALSSNFALYGDLSARVMNIITNSFPDVYIYSIDEAFIDLSKIQTNFDVEQKCSDLSKKIEQYTGIPVSIGIARSKTLAKVANHIAKRNADNRVFSCVSEQVIQNVLTTFAVNDVWGIGRQYTHKLHSLGVYTVAQFLKLPASVLEANFNIVMQRIVQELRGVSCIELRDSDANKKQIMVSRSFGHRVTELQYLQEAISTYASVACEKLRAQGSVAKGLYLFLHTGLHGKLEDTYKNSQYLKLPYATADTRLIIFFAKLGLRHLFKPDFKYQKVGIILCDLIAKQNMQIDLFTTQQFQNGESIMDLLDTVNQRFGRATLQIAAAGLEKPWKNKFARRTNDFTSGWQGLPIVKLE